VLRKIFGPKREKITGSGRNCLTRRFMNFSLPHLLLGDPKSRRVKGAGLVASVEEKKTAYRGDLQETDRVEYRDCKVILE